MEELTHVTVNYKNLEVVHIKESDIIDLNICGITESKNRLADESVGVREEADYIMLQVQEFNQDGESKQSTLYSNATQYDRLKTSKIVDSITLNYKDGTVEEIYVPYSESKEDALEDNKLLTIEDKLIERNYYDSVQGVEMEFNVSEKPY